MKIDIIPIGNSKGIRLPKTLLDQCGFGESVDVTVKDHNLILSPNVKLRSGWDDAFKAMATANDDSLAETPANSFDLGEWEW